MQDNSSNQQLVTVDDPQSDSQMWIEYFGPGYKNREALRKARFGRGPFTPLERWRRRTASKSRRALDLQGKLRVRRDRDFPDLVIIEECGELSCKIVEVCI